jgi:hypothetical protein
MSFELISGTDIEYGLISYDAEGKERPEGGKLMSDALVEKAKAEHVTNVFFFCHGWKGDVPAAKEQYELWIKAFATSDDKARAAADCFPGFKPLYIGLHWPSLPFGDEELGGGSFGAHGMTGPEVLLQAYLDRLGDRPAVRAPLEVIIEAARRGSAPDALPPEVRQAYLDLDAALGLGGGGVAAPPDADRAGFDPDFAFDAGNEAGSSFAGINLGGLLGPLRQLSYWTMKKRARDIGENGMHAFLKRLQTATNARIHLMGHSFGTIVISGMVGGPDARGILVRPVDSVVLVQGAVSLWTYSPDIPLNKAGKGYFSPILTEARVLGPLVTTRSRYDKAVGTLYPLASRLSGSANFAGYPEFGAIGAFGIQGLPDAIRQELPMAPANGTYVFEKAKVYNLDGSQYICHGDGVSGAHSDIAGPEVAHAIWAAALASAT